jgi:hypothetical protein
MVFQVCVLGDRFYLDSSLGNFSRKDDAVGVALVLLEGKGNNDPRWTENASEMEHHRDEVCCQFGLDYYSLGSGVGNASDA